MERRRRVSWMAVVLVIIGCAALYLVGNDRVALWDRDEPRYAMASRWMARTGDWIVPRFGWGADPTEPRTAKPAGIYWAQAGAMKLLGQTVFAARLPSAVATTLLLSGLGLLIGRRFGAARAFWTLLVLGTSAMLVAASKMCVTDAVLLLWVTLGQICLLTLYRGASARWIPILFWIAVALGGLVKGPVVLGVYATTLIVLAGLDAWKCSGFRLPETGRSVFAWWKRLRPITGLLIVTALVAPWLVMVSRASPGFLSTAVGHDVINRMRTGLEEHTGPPGFYLATLFGTFFPWSLLLPLTFVIAAQRWRRRKDLRFALAAIIGPWLLMEAVQTKLVHYVLPIFPPLAYLVADAILRCLRNRHDGLVNRIAPWGATAWGIVMALGALVPLALVLWVNGTPGLAGALAMGIVGAAAGGLLAWLFWQRRPAAGLIAMALGFALFCAAAYGWMLPHATFVRLPVQIAAKLVDLGATQPGDVAMTGYKERSIAWYQGGTIDEVWANHFDTHPVSDWPTWFVLTPRVFNAIPDDRRHALEKVAGFHGLNYAAGRWVDVWIVRKRSAPSSPLPPSGPVQAHR